VFKQSAFHLHVDVYGSLLQVLYTCLCYCWISCLSWELYCNVCYCDRFGDNDVEVAAAAWDDANDRERPSASFVPFPPTATVRPAAAAM